MTHELIKMMSAITVNESEIERGEIMTNMTDLRTALAKTVYRIVWQKMSPVSLEEKAALLPSCEYFRLVRNFLF